MTVRDLCIVGKAGSCPMAKEDISGYIQAPF